VRLLYEDLMKGHYEQALKEYVGKVNLNIGCGHAPEKGWLNVDFNPDSKADKVFDLRELWPLEDNAFDTVLASHVLEHFRDEDLFHIMFEIGRVLRPGGYLIGIVPYATHRTFFANPYHKQAWTEDTPGQFDRRLYDKPQYASTGAHQHMPLQAWDFEVTQLVLDPEWMGKTNEEIAFAKAHYFNVILEMMFILRLAE
jgi:predicted SAM-dependent methyltransferase